jgi:hypothetical protein
MASDEEVAMRSIRSRVVETLILLGLIAAPASGQPATPGEWHRATTLQAVAGGAFGSSDQGGMFGGSAGWTLTPRIAVEASGEWFTFTQGYDAFAGSLVLSARLPTATRANPFVRTGLGMYMASFDGGCGPSFVTAAGACEDANLPSFYRRRWSQRDWGEGGRTFTDPSVIVGGGVDVKLSRRFVLRPAVDARIVFGERQAHVVTSATVGAVFLFEHHPVTPLRRSF